MRKATTRPTTIYYLVQQTDLTVNTVAADWLTAVLNYKEQLRRKLQDKDFRNDLVDFGIIAVMTIAAGALVSLVVAFAA